MQEIFGGEGWVQPRAVASEAGPAPAPVVIPSTSTGNKKRKLENILEELIEDRKEKTQ